LNIYVILLTSVFFVIFSVYLLLPFPTIFAILTINAFGFVCFFIFSRSKVWVFHILLWIASFGIELATLENFQETAYFHIGYVFVGLTLVFIMTGEIWITLCSTIFHLFVLETRFKNKLVTCIDEEGPEVFADKLVKNFVLFVGMLLVITILLVKILEKKTIELSRAKMALEKALDQQKTFVFSFSHELRNPINSLLGNLQLVLQGAESFSAKTKEMLNTAKVCGEILLQNINNVLDTGKHEIGKLEANPVPTQLNELFQRTWGIYGELFRQKRLKSQLRIEKDLPPVVKIDSHKLNQILLNLIGNSIKFTERGSISVTVKWLKYPEVCSKCFEPIPYDETDEGLFEKEENLSTVNISRFSESIPGFLGVSSEGRPPSNSNIAHHHRPQQESKGILKIIVKDTGPGMTKEALGKLFQKFSQVSENVTQRQVGTGLGLFITKEICRIMKGKIRAYSKFNQGTTFVVCIPTISVPISNVQRTDSETILQQLTTKHLKAIVADDSPFNVNLISEYFAKFGASVASVAYNGYDAFMKYKDCKTSHVNIDIIILDIDMPVMDGREACDKIREYEKENRLKPALIILISGNYDKEQIDEYLSPDRGRKADCFLRKPVSFSEFHRAVYSLVVDD